MFHTSLSWQPVALWLWKCLLSSPKPSQQLSCSQTKPTEHISKEATSKQREFNSDQCPTGLGGNKLFTALTFQVCTSRESPVMNRLKRLAASGAAAAASDHLSSNSARPAALQRPETVHSHPSWGSTAQFLPTSTLSTTPNGVILEHKAHQKAGNDPNHLCFTHVIITLQKT